MTRLNSRALTAELGRARTLTELLSLHQRHGNRFDRCNLGAFWSKFKNLPRGEFRELRNHLAPVCERTVRMLSALNARSVANVAHAFAKSGLVGTGPWQHVWVALPEVILRLLRDFTPQHLSNTAWAFAKSRTLAPALFEAISAQAVRRGLGDFKEQELSNTAWAFATARHEAPALFETISAEAVRRGLGDFNEQDLSNTAWAFATAGHEAPTLLNAISAQAMRLRLGGCNEQDVCNIAWALAVFDTPSAGELFRTASFTTRCARFDASFSREGLSQLHQWSLWHEERGESWPGLPESLQQACRDAFVEEEGQPSQLQSDVVREIRSRGFNVEEEHRCKVSGYSIDALVTLNDGQQIAVEVDGPSHFVGRSHKSTGATTLKHRQLRYFGWHLEIVLYWEWNSGRGQLHWLPVAS